MFNKLCVTLIAGSCLVAGCGSSIPEATQEQKKSFAGGPMPEDFKKDFEARRAAGQDAATKARQQNANGPR